MRAECEPFNKRMEISEEKLKAWLRQFNINEESGCEPLQIHASGHASGPEIQALIDAVQPKVLIPIHTTKPELFINKAGEVRMIEKGVSYVF